MIITNIEELQKGKVKIYIDNDYHFWLYHKELAMHHLRENEEISDEVYQDICKNTILRRAKQKALAILKLTDRTEQELICKLRQAEYTNFIISQVLTYIKNYHYIDDARYAVNYVRTRKAVKSKRQIYGELIQKGIEKENIDQAFCEEYDDEEDAIQKAIRKKTKSVGDMTEEEKVKLAASLYRKGFQLDLIKKYVN